jgi:8-oxo-dGTP pyrophosphatase MutT (NUDIX family)
MSPADPRPKLAGGVVIRRSGRAVRVLVVSSSSGRHWVLPKGKIRARRAEPPDRAAVREVREESGACAMILEPLGTFGPDQHGRQVAFFLMQLAAECDSDEDRTVLWLSARRARARLSFAYQRSALDVAMAALRARRTTRRARA